MKNKILMVGATFTVAVILSGCGHNIGTAFQGKAFNIGFDPEFNKLGVQYYDGAMVTGLQKEKSETAFTYEDCVEKDGVSTKSKLVYNAKNGEQVTGYAVDLEKAKNLKEKEK